LLWWYISFISLSAFIVKQARTSTRMQGNKMYYVSFVYEKEKDKLTLIFYIYTYRSICVYITCVYWKPLDIAFFCSIYEQYGMFNIFRWKRIIDMNNDHITFDGKITNDEKSSGLGKVCLFVNKIIVCKFDCSSWNQCPKTNWSK